MPAALRVWIDCRRLKVRDKGNRNRNHSEMLPGLWL